MRTSIPSPTSGKSGRSSISNSSGGRTSQPAKAPAPTTFNPQPQTSTPATPSNIPHKDNATVAYYKRGVAVPIQGTLGNQPDVEMPAFNMQMPDGSVNYDTSISVGNATDPNQIRNLVNTAQQVDAGSATGDRAVDDYTKSMNMNNQAQMDMAVQGANSQQMMNAQQKRSESAISGLNDQAAIYSDAADRFRQALGLQTGVQAAQMTYAFGQQANNIRRMLNVRRNNP